MKTEYSMQHSNPLIEQMPIMGGNTLSDKDREFNLVLEISSLSRLGDSCEDDRDSNSSYDDITKGKKSQNMTECVPVPSSEHVAEIVGRQGCKIKALRNKTNTYIKTPVRGEEPVFVVTGRKEDVAMARREVQSAAEHFTQIRASRSRHALLGQPGIDGEGTPGTITLQVRVPYRVVGLVVGPKGATIKRIQQQTHTYIVTPSREKEPVFEVTGLPENAEKAREEIEAHIAARTGTQHTSIDDDFKSNGTEVGSPSMNDFMQTGLPVPNPMLYKNNSAIPSAFIPYNTNSMLRTAAPSFFPSVSNPGILPPTATNEQLSVVKQQMSMLSNLVTNNSTFTTPSPYQSANVPGFGSNGFQPVEGVKAAQWSTGWSTDTTNLSEASTAMTTFGYGGFSEASTSFSSGFRARSSSSATSHCSSLSPTSSLGTYPRLSPTLSDHQLAGNNNAVDFPTISNYVPATRSIHSAPNLALTIESGYSSSGTNESAAASPVESDSISRLLAQFALDDPVKIQQCVICNECPAVAALVPCGHNLFCYSCANSCVKQPAPKCPCCRQPASMALLIKK